MKLICRILIGLTVTLTVVGCTSKEKKEKKEAENTSQTPAPLKNFERVMPPALLTDPAERAGYIITHYWTHFNFSDTMYCHAPITEQALWEFFSLFQYATYKKTTEGIKKLLDAAEVEVVMYNYFIKMAEQWLYDPNSPMRNDEYYIPFVEHVVASSKVADEHKIRYQYLQQVLYRNRPGSKAEDVIYTTASGSTGRLYNISASYVLLMFYNPDCKECKQTTAQLKSATAISAAVTSGKLKVLAVYPDEKIDIWRNHINDIPESWINGYDKTQAVRNNQTYDLKAIPMLYLLDKDKKVVLKDVDVQAVENYFANN